MKHSFSMAAIVLTFGALVAHAQAPGPIDSDQPKAQEVAIQEIPASKEIVLSPGGACVIRLPNRKTVAVWCRKLAGGLADLENSDLGFEYGEVPFKRLKIERIALPDGGTTFGEYLSYIRQGPVIYTGTAREHVLYVEEYCLSITTKGDVTQTLPLTVSVRLATEKERVPAKQQREYFLKALESHDPKTQLEAIHELAAR